MPRIIVTADRPTDGRDRPIMFTERVSMSDFESDHFQAKLVERLGWAVGDAADVEQRGFVEAAQPEPLDFADELEAEPEPVDFADELEAEPEPVDLADAVALPPLAALSGHYR